jgi:hypothetical protein
MAYYPHNDISGECYNATAPNRWGGSLLCGNTSVVRTVFLTNGIPETWFAGVQIHFYRLTTANDDISAITSGYSGIWMIKAINDKKNSWSAPFVMNHIYNTWWNQGIDFTHMAVVPSMYFNASDPGMIMRFNYTENRELFEIGQMVSGNLQLPLISPKSALLDASTCSAGDYYHDPTNRYLHLYVSGKGKPLFTYLDVNGIKCRYLCPQPQGEYVKEPFIRLWSNATQWPNGTMPVAGDNVTVNGNWTIIMDVDPAPIKYLIINGDVFIGSRNTTIMA